jgi:hypothetical protein
VDTAVVLCDDKSYVTCNFSKPGFLRRLGTVAGTPQKAFWQAGFRFRTEERPRMTGLLFVRRFQLTLLDWSWTMDSQLAIGKSIENE